MKLLFNLVAVQPIHNAKFHGGGSYGEVVFWSILQRLKSSAESTGHSQTSSMACLYDSKKYLDPQILAACKQQGIVLHDIHTHTSQEIIDAQGFDTFYTPLYSLESIFRIEIPRYVFTWHGVRALEIAYSPLSPLGLDKGLYWYIPQNKVQGRPAFEGIMESLWISVAVSHICTVAILIGFFTPWISAELPWYALSLVFYSASCVLSNTTESNSRPQPSADWNLEKSYRVFENAYHQSLFSRFVNNAVEFLSIVKIQTNDYCCKPMDKSNLLNLYESLQSETCRKPLQVYFILV